MMLLISLAIIVAFLASAATSLGWFDLEFWWELALLVTIMLLGHWQEMKAIDQAQSALDSLAALLPDEAERIGDQGNEVVPLHMIAKDDLVLVRPGSRVPAGGLIEEGTAELDESMITGESRPVEKRPDDRVAAGTVVSMSSIRVRVEATGDDTSLAGIQKLVAQPRAHVPVRRHWQIASPPPSSTSPPVPEPSRSSSGVHLAMLKMRSPKRSLCS